MMEGVNMVRQAISSVTHVVDTGIAHSSSAYYQLTEEDNLPARVGVITGSGLLGLAVGMSRGRLVKRVVYTMVREGMMEGVNRVRQAISSVTHVVETGIAHSSS